MSDLYDTDVLLWSERQSSLLRRVAAGEPVGSLLWEDNACLRLIAASRKLMA